MTIVLTDIYRYPVKGLPGEALASVDLAAGAGLPHDRRFALARGDARLATNDLPWRPKQWFVVLMRDAELARLACRVDVAAQTVELRAPRRPPCRSSFATTEGRAELDAYVNEFLGDRPEGAAHWVEAGDVSLTDVPQNCLSLVNLASVANLGEELGVTLDPRRFRANLYIDGAAPWAEFDWIGQEIRLGKVTLRLPARIPRCNAINVDLETGTRGVNLIQALRTHCGHYDVGVYAEVTKGGRIQVGDAVSPPGQARPRSWFSHWIRFFGFLARSAPLALGRGPRRGSRDTSLR